MMRLVKMNREEWNIFGSGLFLGFVLMFVAMMIIVECRYCLKNVIAERTNAYYHPDTGLFCWPDNAGCK